MFRSRSPLAVLLAAALSAAGCGNSTDPLDPQTDVQDAGLASVDAKGGESVIGNQVLGPDLVGADGSQGGTVRVSSARGDVTVTTTDPGVAAPAGTLAGTGIDVAPGETLAVSGRQAADFLRVQAGGVLALTANTIFEVTGDVIIAGTVQSRSGVGARDGHDLTLTAGGRIVITGMLDCGGVSNSLSPDLDIVSGGNGGTILLTAGSSSGSATEPDFFISGVVRSNGGEATADVYKDTNGRPGSGGSIWLGSHGTMVLSGKVVARGGATSATFLLGGGLGGQVQLIALDDLTIGNATKLSVDGGDTTGLTGGGGGSLTLEAPVGMVSVVGTEFLCRGGSLTGSDFGSAGSGGDFIVSCDRAVLNNALVSVDGGGITPGGAQTGRDIEGVGGGGGRIEVAGVSALTFGPSLALHARGGQSSFLDDQGGAGGTVKLVHLLERPQNFSFQSTVDVRGGLDMLGSLGEPGDVCYRGAGAIDVARMLGSNQFPVSPCATAAEGGVEGSTYITHDLDCDPATILPGSVNSQLPAATGVEFFRARVDGADAVRIVLTGQDGGDVDLYAGRDVALGSLDANDYRYVSAETGPEESVEIDLTTFTPGEYIAIAVIERTAIAEKINLELTCVGAGDEED